MIRHTVVGTWQIPTLTAVAVLVIAWFSDL